jgi:four helix bundle protein
MALYKLEELVCYQLSMDLKDRVLTLLYSSPAQHDAKLASQIGDAASSVSSNIAEGFHRFNPGEFAQFVKYARGSLQEVRTRLPDGVAKRHYTQADITEILQIADRLSRVLGGFYFSLKRQAEARRDRKREPKAT